MGIRFTVDYYITANGKSPTLEALANFEKVSPSLRDAVMAGIEKLEYRTNHSGSLTEYVCPDLWCLRVVCNNNCARLFFTFTKGAKIYLLNGYVKRTRKIPNRELAKAKRILKEAKLCLATT